MAKRETIAVDPCEVLAILEKSRRRRVWSSIAAELHEIDRADVSMPHVRGVRDACRRLAAVRSQQVSVWIDREET